MDRRRDRRVARAKLWEEYLSWSTVHGVSHYGRAQTKCYRGFWAIAFILCVIGMLLSLGSLIFGYLKFEKRVNIDLLFGSTTFPAVTVCSLNPYKRSAALKVDALKEMLNAFNAAVESARSNNVPVTQDASKTNRRRKRSREKRAAPLTTITVCACEKANPDKCEKRNPTAAEESSACVCVLPENTKCQRCESIMSCDYVPPATTTTTTTSTTSTTPAHTTSTTTSTSTSTLTTSTSTFTTEKPTTTQAVPANAYGFEEGQDEMATKAKAQENLPFIAASMDAATKKTLTFKTQELIRNCAFNTRSCDIMRDFHNFNDEKYGQCFTFNYMSPPAYNSTRAGPLYGLRLLLFSNVSEYMETTETAGSRVVIHDQENYPFPDSFGFNAPVGTASSFSIRNSRMERLKAPYGNCTDFEESKNLDHFYEGKYNMESCQRSCLQKKIIEKCGCGDPRFPLRSNSTSGEKHCTINMKEAKDCLTNFNFTVGDADSCQKACPVPCREATYQVTISSSKWPHGSAAVPGCEDKSSAACKETTESGLMVEVYYEQLGHQLIWETNAYPTSQLLADLAGQVGFWIGVSVVSMIEVGVILGRCLALLCRRQRHTLPTPDIHPYPSSVETNVETITSVGTGRSPRPKKAQFTYTPPPIVRKPPWK